MRISTPHSITSLAVKVPVDPNSVLFFNLVPFAVFAYCQLCPCKTIFPVYKSHIVPPAFNSSINLHDMSTLIFSNELRKACFRVKSATADSQPV